MKFAAASCGLLSEGFGLGHRRTYTSSSGPDIADANSLLHDPAHSARYLAASDLSDRVAKAETWLLQGFAALDRSDAVGDVQPLAVFDKAWPAIPDVHLASPDQSEHSNIFFIALNMTDCSINV